MNKCLFFLFFLSCCTNAFSQNVNNLQLGVICLPNMGKAFYIGSNQYILDKISHSEHLSLGYSFGVMLNYNISRRIGIETGLLYTQKQLKTIFELNSESVKENYHSIDIPGRINFWVNRSRLSLLIGLGCNLNILTKYDGHFTSDTDNGNFSLAYYQHSARLNDPNAPTRGQSENVDLIVYSNNDSLHRKLNFTPFILAGLDFAVNNKLSIRLEPVFRYSLLNSDDHKIISTISDYNIPNQVIHNDNYAQQHLWSIGLNTGIYFAL